MWDLFWASIGIGALYLAMWYFYHEFVRRAIVYIAAKNFAKSGKVVKRELPYCCGCGDRHKEPMCY